MVLFPRLLLAAAIVAGSAMASGNSEIAKIFMEIPSCGIKCLVDTVTTFSCPLNETRLLSDCICTNNHAQSAAAACVQRTCQFKDQVVVRDLTIYTLCPGYPQEDRSKDLRAIAIAGFVVPTPVVVVRIMSRLYSSGRLWWDDYTCLLSLACFYCMVALQLAGADLGFGTHIWVIGEEPGLVLLKYFWIGQVMYIAVQVFAKVSILILYLRLFTTPWFQRFCKIGMGFMLIHGLGYIMIVIFQCTPIKTVYDRTADGRCIDFLPIAYSGAALSILEDVILVVIPIPELWSLHLTFKKKVGLILMFAIGLLATITSIVRTNYLIKIGYTYDQSWDNADPVIWSVIEEVCAIVCGSLPSCRALVSAGVALLWTKPAAASSSGGSGARKNSSNGQSDQAMALASSAEKRKRFSLYRLTTEIDTIDLDYDDLGRLRGDYGAGDELRKRPSLCRVDEAPERGDFPPPPPRSRRMTELGASPDDPSMVSVQIHSPGEVVQLARRPSTDVRPQSLAETLMRRSVVAPSLRHRSFSVVDDSWISPTCNSATLASGAPSMPSLPEIDGDRVIWPLPQGSVTLVHSDGDDYGGVDVDGPPERFERGDSISTDLGSESALIPSSCGGNDHDEDGFTRGGRI